MALIQCPECGGNVSSNAKVCIHCGTPLTASNCSNTNRSDDSSTNQSGISPTTLTKVIAVCGISVGFLDVLLATEGFQDEYTGLLSFLVGDEAFTSAFLAAFVWIIASLAIGFAAARIYANKQKDKK